MRKSTEPMSRQVKAYVLVAGAGLVVLTVAAVLMLRPTPRPMPVVIRAPEWRCASQTKGGPICERALPPATAPSVK